MIPEALELYQNPSWGKLITIHSTTYYRITKTMNDVQILKDLCSKIKAVREARHIA